MGSSTEAKNGHATKIALCTTCKGRLEHLRQTLPANLAANADLPPERCVFVLLDYNSRDGLADWVRSEMAEHLRTGRLVYYRFAEPGPFRMAHAKNLSHRLGIREGAAALCNVDADNFTGEGFARYVLDNLNEDTFLWAKMVKEEDGRLPRGISGRIAVTAEQFRLVGGYDERYHTWSPDDKDFNQRLCKLGFSGREIDPQYLQAILHNDKIRFREYRDAALMATPEEFELAGRDDVRVVNGGNVGCGTVYRDFDSHPVAVEPLPTRVFGIGMHKTGTTSLAKALTRLGFRCAHWPSAHWAKRVYNDVASAGSSALLERTSAAADMPIGLLFRELDAAYPGSKFVLTVRNEWDWLASVERHFSPDNKFFQSWNSDPFSHRLHTLLYGRKRFDRDVFLARYRRHNTEVKEYFRGRRGDLLEFDITQGGDWHELCAFLRVPVPRGTYPRENSSSVGNEAEVRVQ